MRTHSTLLGAVLLAFVSALSYAQAPVPFINLPLMPDATAPGGAQFTLTVNGTGFVSTSVVNWNGTALATRFVSGSQLTAIVPASDIATASTGWVTVVNPAPGGGTSNVVFFSVTRNERESVFGLASAPATGYRPRSVAVGDFNGDGKLDLAVLNSCGNDPKCHSEGSVSILLGDGAGNFTLASSPLTGGFYSHGWYSGSVAVGDFNGDGKLDLVVTNACYIKICRPQGIGGDVYILLGDGTGKFVLNPTRVWEGAQPLSVAVADFNGDGNLDLAVSGGDAVSILLGDGTGNFTLHSTLAVGGGPLAIGDFNGDGILDFAVANSTSNTVSILLGDGTGKFTLVSSPATGSGPSSVAVGDFNGDGKLDLAVANGSGNTVSILLGDGTGHFNPASSTAVGDAPMSVAVGDFNGDGKLDLAVVNSGSNTVSILVGAPPGPAVTYSPSSVNFGAQLVGTTSNPQPVTVTNSGSETLEIRRIAASANFSQNNNCPSKIPAGGQCTINVTFTPPGRGRHLGTVTIKDNAPTSPQEIPLTGVGTVVTLLPSSLEFGDQKVKTTSAPLGVTLTNYGKTALVIHDILIRGKNYPSFAQTNNCGTSVPAGGNCTISVTFTPQWEGSKIATLEVKDNGGGSPQEVALSGTGTK